MNFWQCGGAEMNKLKNKLRFEIRELKSEIGGVEYAFWWLVRILMFVGSVDCIDSGDTGHLLLQMWSNTALLFVLPEFHILPRKWCFFSRLSYHNQTVAALMVLLTSYLGNYRNFYGNIEAFDFYVHFFSGIVCVFVGYDLAKALAPSSKDKFDTNIKTITGFGLSCFAAVFWEIYEFVFDAIMASSTQAHSDSPEKILAMVIHPHEVQFPLFDTMTDLMAGFLGAVVGGVVFRIILGLSDKKEK